MSSAILYTSKRTDFCSNLNNSFLLVWLVRHGMKLMSFQILMMKQKSNGALMCDIGVVHLLFLWISCAESHLSLTSTKGLSALSVLFGFFCIMFEFSSSRIQVGRLSAFGIRTVVYLTVRWQIPQFSIRTESEINCEVIYKQTNSA